jgi:hypothetical protein
MSVGNIHSMPPQTGIGVVAHSPDAPRWAPVNG